MFSYVAKLKINVEGLDFDFMSNGTQIKQHIQCFCSDTPRVSRKKVNDLNCMSLFLRSVLKHLKTADT